MQNILVQELEAVLPEGMHIPPPLIQLYEWIVSKQLYKETEDATYGFLYPEHEMKQSWTDTGREGGTDIEFVASGNVNLKYWFGKENEELNSRLCVFGRTGADGSECALWLTDSGQVKIIHMGSGSGSTLACVLADNAVDFLRLLAIGYDEICWSEEFAYPPNTLDKEFRVEPNVEFQEWVKNTFNVTIPQNALEIIKHPASMDDDASDDEFFNWYQKFID
ncbi:hypothetical protein J0X19_10340 [Hymenobacter sp. BT186]|uniref:SMI1/KNR4 family protein n=1 Tax=Hymenobacter telluris TaxID=2816474 RepID=A0A939EYQ5_9BACT|nr:hypothetical protein [Hymenobacter telluris]MBO0358343.1 hypothetical protein [Hymenobacter telluris]MBW3374369.1 hypothetical protein [Hymenobacter norwichensis]